MPLALLAFLAFVLVVAGDRGAMLALRKTETTSGRVTAVQERRNCGAISYSFTTRAGVSFRGSQVVCVGSPYDGVLLGDSVPVVYVKSKPAINALADANNTNPAVFLSLAIFPLFGLFVLAPLIWPRISQLRTDRKLFCTGSLVKGRVVFVAAGRDSPWGPGWSFPTRGAVFVAAQLRSGGEQEVKAACTNHWLLGQLAPGSEVNVCVKGNKAVLLENYFR
jgi:Protein of unknown function (DUF3592)